MRLSTSHGEVGASCLRSCLLAWFSSCCSAFYNPQRYASATVPQTLVRERLRVKICV